MTQLIGRIYWVLDDFTYNGNIIPTKDSTAHAATRLKYAIIQDHMVKFQTEPINYFDNKLVYDVNLTINDIGTRFVGTFSEVTDDDRRGDVSCELFENSKAFFLYGNWIEDEYNYTWWARIEKDKT
jgi:hypothetical protein